MYGGGMAFGGGEKEALVAQVKAYQRQSEGHKQAWYSFCGTQGTTNYDPNRHDEETLRLFITSTETGAITPDPNAVATPSWTPSWTGGGADSWGCGKGCGGDWFGGGGKGDGWGGKGCKGTKGGGCDPWGMMAMQQAMMAQWMGGKGGGGKGGWEGGGGCGGGGGGPGELPSGGRPGDWFCPNCGNINFSNRDKCNKCETPRGNQARLGMKAGDWICPACGDLVFATKSACKMCGTPRPIGNEVDSGFGAVSTGAAGADWRASPY